MLFLTVWQADSVIATQLDGAAVVAQLIKRDPAGGLRIRSAVLYCAVLLGSNLKCTTTLYAGQVQGHCAGLPGVAG